VYLKDLYSNLIGNRTLIDSLVARAEDELREALEATLDNLRARVRTAGPGVGRAEAESRGFLEIERNRKRKERKKVERKKEKKSKERREKNR